MRRNAPLPRLAALILMSAVFGPPASAAENEVRIFFWYDYVPAGVIADFEKETGIKVTYDSFEATEMLTTKLMAGKSGYDVVMPTASVLGRYIKAGVLQTIDAANVSNKKDLDPSVMKVLADQDPANDYALPYAYGTTGIAYIPAKITERMAEAPIDSLDIIFKPELAAKFADCGIAMVDSPEGVMSVALNYLGFDPFSSDEQELAKATELLMAIRPHIRHFKTGAIINELANADICLALAWSGDTYIAAGRAEEANAGVEVAYAIPKEGTEIFADVMAVPADAPNAGNAHLFMDYILRPEVIAKVTNELWYPNANAAATSLVDEAIRSDPNIYPAPEMMQKLFPAKPRDDRDMRQLMRQWTRFQTGQR